MATKIWKTTANGDWGTTGNWTGGTPTTGDDVYIPAGTPAITAGLNQSAVSLGAVYFQAGYTNAVASSAAYLQLTCTAFSFAGTGQAYIDLGGSTIGPIVTASANGTTGVAGLYLKGSALTTLYASGGNIALAGLAGETSTVATVRISQPGTVVTLGSGVSLTTNQVSGGTLYCNCAFTTSKVYGGTFWHLGTGAGTTITITGGFSYPISSGTIGTYNANGGSTDTTKGAVGRTFSAVKINPGATFIYDPNVLTITALTAPDSPIRLIAQVPA